jgi:hypothetical protein
MAERYIYCSLSFQISLVQYFPAIAVFYITLRGKLDTVLYKVEFTLPLCQYRKVTYISWIHTGGRILPAEEDEMVWERVVLFYTLKTPPCLFQPVFENFAALRLVSRLQIQEGIVEISPHL